MADIWDELGVSKETQQEAGTQTVASTWPAGVYDVVVVQAYIRKTDKGAKMLEIDFQEKDGDKKLHYSTCTHAGDEKKNKETFGVHALKHFLDAAGEPTAGVQPGKVKHFNETIDALGILGVPGKAIKIGVIEEENLYQGSISIRNTIKAFLQADGKNSAGEGLTAKLAENIAKNPIKKAKASTGGAQQPNAAQSTDAAAAKKSGW